MRYLYLALILFISTNAYEKELQQWAIIDRSIKSISPSISKSYSKRIARALLASSKKWKVDWRIMLAILQQESSLKVDPGNCALKKSRCRDFGIGQINFKTWGEKLSLSKKKLLNPEYNIDVTGNILSLVREGHEKDPNWYSRYHSLTPKHRKIYRGYIRPIHRKIIKLVNLEYYQVNE